MEDTLLGRLAINYGFLDEGQLDQALREQKSAGASKFLGEILVEHGLLTPKQLERLLSFQERRQSIADVTGPKPHADAAKLESAGLTELLEFQIESNAIELHLSTGSRPVLRRHGTLVDLGGHALPESRMAQILDELLPAELREDFERDWSVDFVHELGDQRFRVNAFKQRRGDAVIFKLIPRKARTPEVLGLPQVVSDIAGISHGLVLVTGPRGAGKSTTLAAIVELVNRLHDRHIVTIEKPIETVYQSRRSLVVQRQVGRDVDSFSDALRSSLREDPDVIVVSELEGPDEITTALTAAETGHLVLGTMMTTNAIRTMLRILDAYTGTKRDFIRTMMAGSLRVILSQQLVPSVDGSTLHLAAEIMTASPAVSNMIREDRIHQIPSVMQTSREASMILMDDALLALVRAGKISGAEALARAQDPKKFVDVLPRKVV